MCRTLGYDGLCTSPTVKPLELCAYGWTKDEEHAIRWGSGENDRCSDPDITNEAECARHWIECGPQKGQMDIFPTWKDGTCSDPTKTTESECTSQQQRKAFCCDDDGPVKIMKPYRFWKLGACKRYPTRYLDSSFTSTDESSRLTSTTHNTSKRYSTATPRSHEDCMRIDLAFPILENGNCVAVSSDTDCETVDPSRPMYDNDGTCQGRSDL